MKIAYIVDYDISSESGVIQKILQQSKIWGKQGCFYYIVSLKTLSIYDHSLTEIYKIKNYNFSKNKLGTALRLFVHSYKLSLLLKEISFDIIYTRYHLYNPFMVKIYTQHKVVMEINSDDKAEYEAISKLTHFYNVFTRNLTFKSIDGFVCVSHELAQRFSIYSNKIKVIANGIDVSKYHDNYLINNMQANDRPTLVFIGSPKQTWHGLDKIVDLASQTPEFNYYVIGSNGENTKNCHFLGYLPIEEANEVIYTCDIGICTLSLYKLGMNEASPLKSRHYLACGLPIIYAFEDTDLQGNESFVLKLTNSEDNIDIEEIKKYVWQVFGNKSTYMSAKIFAENILDYSVKEKERVGFFKECILDEKT